MKLKIFYVGKGPLGEIDTTDFSTTVSDLKEKVAPMAGLQPGSIQLYYAGKRLYEDTKLADCGFPGKAESITIICMPQNGAAPPRSSSVELKKTDGGVSSATSIPISSSPTSSASTPGSSPAISPSSSVADPIPEGKNIPAVVNLPSQEPDQVTSTPVEPVVKHSNNASDLVIAAEDGGWIDSAIRTITHHTHLLSEASSADSDAMKDSRHFGSVQMLLAKLKSTSDKKQPFPRAFQVGDPFAGLTVPVSDLAHKSLPDYQAIVKFVQAVETRLHMQLWRPYFEALKGKFERLLVEIKGTRNQELVDILMVRQSELNKIVKEIIERPTISETITERQGNVDARMAALEAAVKAFHDAELKEFDSNVEHQLKQLIPQLGDLERITEEKLVQLDTLRAIYNQFAPLTKEKEDHKSSMEILSPPRASQLSATKADLSRLRQNFSAIVAESASRQSEIAKERQALSTDKAAVADEQKLILMLMLKLSEQYEKNEGKINDIAAKETELARESEDRKNLLEDVTADVNEHEQKLESHHADLEAGLKAIKAFTDGSVEEFTRLEAVTASRKADYVQATLKTLDEKYAATTHHYRIIFKRSWALRAFKRESADIIAELQDQLHKWSSLHRSTMVDTFKEQLAKTQTEIISTDTELQKNDAALRTLDLALADINSNLEEIGAEPKPHPRVDIEILCLERDRLLLEHENEKSSQGEKARQEKLRLVSSQIDANLEIRRANSVLLANSISAPASPAKPATPSSPTPTPFDASFVQIPQND